MKREELVKRTLCKEELAHIEEFCLTSSRIERMEILSAMKREFKSIQKDVADATKRKWICGHVAGQLKKLIDTYKQEFRQFSETQKVMPAITKELMINFRVVRNVIENSLSDVSGCRDDITVVS
jgi:hypothetical protein